MRSTLPYAHGVRRTALPATALLAVLLLACGSSSTASGPDAAADLHEDAASDSPVTPETDADANNAPTADASATADTAPMNDTGTAPPTDAATGASSEAGATMSLYVTFYGWADNSPPGGAIAYPKSGGYPTLHETAGGTGTYADPITFATDKAEFAVGTRLYVPFIEKYVIMEDDCVECDSDWTSSRKWHIDLWMNSNGTASTSSLTSCEDRWTRDSTSVEIDPPDGRTVTTTPLFTPATNTCRTTP
jgi:3D (Asp-Asp-Asp) domain-containing protein